MMPGIPILNQKTRSRAARALIRLFGLFLLASAFSVHAQLIADWDAAAETAVIFNPDFPGSAELATYYAEQRHIPKERVIGLRCSQEDSISRGEFEAQLRGPLLQLFESRHWWNAAPPTPGKPLTGEGITTTPSSKVRVLVLMRGIPFKSVVQRKSPNNPRKTKPASTLNLPCSDSTIRPSKAACVILTSTSRHVSPMLKTHLAS